MTEEQSDIITMADMATVFDVTDALSIDRELISVELTKEDPGSVQQAANGEIENRAAADAAARAVHGVAAASAAGHGLPGGLMVRTTPCERDSATRRQVGQSRARSG